jgi:hypothetical protein
MNNFWKYSKGSVWRKWDLQVATNKYGNRYSGISLIIVEHRLMKEIDKIEID